MPAPAAMVSSSPGRTASSWRRNSASSAVKLALSAGVPQVRPQATGYSQSMSMPSNTPAAAPAPPAPSVTGRLPRM